MVQLHTAAEMSMGSSDNDAMASSMSTTMMRFHTGSGDTLWFSPFTPSSGAAVLGACILLFFIGILSRFIDATQRTMTIVWLHKSMASSTNSSSTQKNTTSVVSWRPISDSGRGVLFLFHSAFQYLLMLAVMTFNVYYFIAVLLGLGLGEAVFGRFGRHTHIISRPALDRNDSTEKIVE